MSATTGRRIALVAAGLVFAVPLLYMIEVSLHAEGHGLSESPLALGGAVHFENYARALERMGDFRRLLFNTVLVTVLSIVGQLACCSLAGFAFARLEFRGRDGLFLLVVATMMLPDHVTAIPRFLLFRWMGAVDTYYPLILPTVLGGAPFFIFLFRQYFLSLPSELSEAARVDGASPLRAYWSVFLPLARPMLATVAIFTFLATWNDFWAPLIYLSSPEKRTLTLALAGFHQTYNTAVEHMMAAATVVVAPCILVYFFTQRVFLRGVRVAATKG
ncbi:MAG: carbohydrate ABC transporter permease [bacterium]|nr:carbohydrate ABC transporter permease [bacterium]